LRGVGVSEGGPGSPGRFRGSVLNFVIELYQEIDRVNALLPKLEILERERAIIAIRFARAIIELNSVENIRESIDDLREFVKPSLAHD
jgi:hypothetical protein